MTKLAFCFIFLALFCSSLEAKTTAKPTTDNPKGVHPKIENPGNGKVAATNKPQKGKEAIDGSKNGKTATKAPKKGGTKTAGKPSPTEKNSALEEALKNLEINIENATTEAPETDKTTKSNKDGNPETERITNDSEKSDSFGKWDTILEAPETKSSTTSAPEKKDKNSKPPKNVSKTEKTTTNDTPEEVPEDWDIILPGDIILPAPGTWESGTTTTGAPDKKPTTSKPSKVVSEAATTTNPAKNSTLEKTPGDWDSETKGTTTGAPDKKPTTSKPPKVVPETATTINPARNSKLEKTPGDWNSESRGTTTAAPGKKPKKTKPPTKVSEAERTTSSAKNSTLEETLEGWDAIIEAPTGWDIETKGTTTAAPGKGHKKTKPTKGVTSGKKQKGTKPTKGLAKTGKPLSSRKDHTAGVNETGVLGEILTLSRTMARSILRNFFQFFGLDLDTSKSIDWFQIGLKLIDLYQQNITHIVPYCLNHHPISLIVVPEKLINDTSKCIFGPFKSLTQDGNGTIADAMKIYTDFMNFLQDIQDVDKVFALLKLAISEEKNLMDLNLEVVRVTNATFDLLLLPACLVQEVGGAFRDFQAEYNQTLCCIKAELDKVDCQDAETD